MQMDPLQEHELSASLGLESHPIMNVAKEVVLKVAPTISPKRFGILDPSKFAQSYPFDKA